MKLQVMICTYGAEGLQRVARMALPSLDGVGYIVSCQSRPVALPASLCRDDILVSFTPTTGLSNNRNHALSLVSAQYALVADDDLVFEPDGLSAVIRAFDEHPDVDIATFMCRYPHPKTYPAVEHDLDIPYKGYFVISFEIAMRVEAVRRLGLWFSPLMGIGAPYLHAGEENMFVFNALRRGARGRFFPVVIAEHPQFSTGYRDQERPGVLRAQGAYLRLTYGISRYPRYWLKAYRTTGSTLRNLHYVLQGARYGHRHRADLLNPRPQ